MMLFTEPILMALASAGSRLVSSAPRYYRSRHSSRFFLSASWQQEDEEQASTLPQNTSPSIATANRIQDLISHPAVVWDEATTFSSMHKKKLGRRHLSLFDRRSDNGTGGSSGDSPTRDHLFDQFAQTVCHAGVVARKEIFETWAAACYIYSSFFGDEAINNNEMPQINRVADVAAGHGLLAWALLILDDEHRRRSNDSGSSLPPLTAFCLDVTMPRSAEIIHSSMVRRWAHLESQFDYVEGRLEQLAPHPSCLLASVHGCGILSDILVSTASEHGIPLAVVPCCHSRKRIVLDVASPFAKAHYDDIINMNGSIPDLSERLDEARMIALLNSGHDVKEVFLPKIFTDKNRLIIGVPTNSQTNHSFTKLSINQRHQPLDVVRKGRMPSLNSPIMPKSRFLKGFCVPCKDDNETRLVVTELAGRVAAKNRKEVMHNRFHEKYPHMDISLWLPEVDVGISEDAISRIVKSTNNVECKVTKVGSVYVSQSGRRAQTFRIQYAPSSDDDIGILSFGDAKRMHEELYANIPNAFPGAECR